MNPRVCICWLAFPLRICHVQFVKWCETILDVIVETLNMFLDYSPIKILRRRLIVLINKKSTHVVQTTSSVLLSVVTNFLWLQCQFSFSKPFIWVFQLGLKMGSSAVYVIIEFSQPLLFFCVSSAHATPSWG